MTNYSSARGVDLAAQSSQSTRPSYIALVLGVLSVPGSILTWGSGLPGQGFVWGLPVAVAAVVAGILAVRRGAGARWAAATGMVLGGAMALMIVLWTAFGS
ncbi:MAG: hypothetical protein ABIO16_13335 [Nocardioides sp.]